MLGSESFTRWLIWSPSASTRDSTSASIQELGKSRKFLHLYLLQGHSFFNYVSVWVSPTTWHCQHHWICIPFQAKWKFVGPFHLPKFWGKNNQKYFFNGNNPLITVFLCTQSFLCSPPYYSATEAELRTLLNVTYSWSCANTSSARYTPTKSKVWIH